MVLVLAAGVASAGRAQPMQPPPAFERFSNGLRVMVVVDRQAPLVHIECWVQGGAGRDESDQTGLTQLAWETPRTGAEGPRPCYGCELETTADACILRATVAPTGLAEVLDRCRAQLDAQRIDGDAFRESLRTTLEKAREAKPPAANWFYPLTEPGAAHREGWPTPASMRALFQGTPDAPADARRERALAQVRLEDVREWAAEQFTASDAFVLIVGDIEPTHTIEAVRQALGTLPWRERHKQQEARPAAGGSLTAECPAAASGLEMAWVTPPAGALRNVALDVLMHYLCSPAVGPLSARLERAGLGGAEWTRRAFRSAGLLALGVGPLDAQTVSDPKASIAEAARIVEEELQCAAARPLAALDLVRARELAASHLRFERRTLAGRGRVLADCEGLGGDLLLSEFLLPRTLAVTAGEVQEAAASLLQARRVTTRLVAKEDADTERDAAAAAPAIASLSPCEFLERVSPRQSPGHDRAAASSRAPAQPTRDIRRTAFENGLVLRVVAAPESELAAVQIVAVGKRMGRARSDFRLPAGWTSEELRDFYALRGLYSRAGHDRVRHFFRIVGPRDALPGVMELMAPTVRSLSVAQVGLRGVILDVVGEVDAAAIERQVAELFQTKPTPREFRWELGATSASQPAIPLAIHWIPDGPIVLLSLDVGHDIRAGAAIDGVVPVYVTDNRSAVLTAARASHCVGWRPNRSVSAWGLSHFGLGNKIDAVVAQADVRATLRDALASCRVAESATWVEAAWARRELDGVEALADALVLSGLNRACLGDVRAGPEVYETLETRREWLRGAGDSTLGVYGGDEMLQAVLAEFGSIEAVR